MNDAKSYEAGRRMGRAFGEDFREWAERRLNLHEIHHAAAVDFEQNPNPGLEKGEYVRGYEDGVRLATAMSEPVESESATARPRIEGCDGCATIACPRHS